MIYYPISALINAIASTLVFIAVFLKNPRAQVNRAFGYFAFSVAFWSYCYFFWQVSSDANSALFWCRALMAGAIFIPVTFFHFSISLIEQFKKYFKTILFWYIVSIAFIMLNFTPFFVKDIKPRLCFPYWPTAGVAYAPFLAMFAILTIYAHILMYRSSRNFSNAKRNQIKYVFLGTAIGFLGGATNYPLWYDIPILPVGNALVAVYVILVAYSIVKYRLMDINVVLTRAGIFAIVYVVILSIPFWIGFKYGLWKHSTWIMLILATAGPSIYTYLRRQAENVMLKDQRRYQQTLLRASEGMTLIKELDKLLRLIVHILTRTIGLKYAAIYIYDKNTDNFQLKAKRGESVDGCAAVSPESPLLKFLIAEKNPITSESLNEIPNDKSLEFEPSALRKEMNFLSAFVIVPSIIENNLLAFLVLGEKKSRHVYTEDDLNVFMILANHASLAIENALFYKEASKTLAEKFHEHRLWSLGKMGSGIGHQINNRFNAVTVKLDTMRLLDLEQLKETPLSQKQKELLVTIESVLVSARDEAMRGGEIATSLTNFSRKASDYKGILLEKAVKGAVDLLSCKFKQDELGLIQDYPFNGPFIYGNMSQLQDVFVNLLDNARDAMAKKKEEIIAGSLKSAGPFIPKIIISGKVLNRSWQIQVQDNGIGMALEEQNQLFVPFFTTKATAEKGTGLGLSIIKQIIEAHKGLIEIKSAYGEGTTFIIKLPIYEDTKNSSGGKNA